MSLKASRHKPFFLSEGLSLRVIHYHFLIFRRSSWEADFIGIPVR